MTKQQQNVLQRAYNEAQGSLKDDSYTILDLFDSSAYVMSSGYVILLNECPAPFPPISVIII